MGGGVTPPPLIYWYLKAITDLSLHIGNLESRCEQPQKLVNGGVPAEEMKLGEYFSLGPINIEKYT